MPLIIALFIIGNWFHAGNTERAIKNTDEQQRQQQVYEILRLTNAINDWKYHHPGDIREGKMLTVNETGFAPVYGTKHINFRAKNFCLASFSARADISPE
ncbi:putative PilM protein [Escherichia coli]|uniref:Putative PilM protein n=1 Tax=Escherichia coli TaxID=562 RepID=A0A376KHN0_ECOLX|nr:putative PilM protein [Escherichia coli]